MSPSTSSVRSFDVFDTVLTRRVGAPTALVSLLGRRLEEQELIPVRDVVFAETRNSREWQLTQLLGRHATLLEIHEAVADALSVDRAQAATWVEAERQLERELTIPVPGAQRRLDEARREGTVVFV
ncbi:MAG: hypothetical protein JOZ82_05405, partial [Marmoricola sp.]|nr:hypothetical protein [Marmoricola sp.]